MGGMGGTGGKDGRESGRGEWPEESLDWATLFLQKKMCRVGSEYGVSHSITVRELYHPLTYLLLYMLKKADYGREKGDGLIYERLLLSEMVWKRHPLEKAQVTIVAKLSRHIPSAMLDAYGRIQNKLICNHIVTCAVLLYPLVDHKKIATYCIIASAFMQQRDKEEGVDGDLLRKSLLTVTNDYWGRRIMKAWREEGVKEEASIILLPRQPSLRPG